MQDLGLCGATAEPGQLWCVAVTVQGVPAEVQLCQAEGNEGGFADGAHVVPVHMQEMHRRGQQHAGQRHDLVA